MGADFAPFDLGHVLQTAEQIKGMRRQSTFDTLREQATRQQIDQNAAQETRAQSGFQAQMDERTARQHYLANQAIETADDPITAARQFAPENIQQFEQAHGPGSFDQLSADQVRQIATYAKTQAATKAGIGLPTTDNKPNSVREFEYARSQGYKGGYESWQKDANALPANLQEWAYYNKLPPADQRRFLELKRTQQTFALGEVAGAPGAFSKQTGTFTPLATVGEQAAGKAEVAGATAGAQESAKATATAAFDLPRVERTVDQALQDMQKLKAHPGLPYITGLYSKAPLVPGTKQAAADALAQQVKGQTFLQAYQSLKGGGAITEVEGTKAESAIARLARAQSTKDYQQALDDLGTVLKNGLDQAKKQAGKGGSQPAQPATPTATGPNGEKIVLRNGQWVRQ